MSAITVIIDCKEGNVNAIYKSMARVGRVKVATSPSDIAGADKLILPGVGHFKKTMEALQQHRLLEALHEAVLIQQKPVLGICLGMQLMASSGEEGNCSGLGWMQAEVVRFRVCDQGLRIPHMGWNTVIIRKECPLLKKVEPVTEFYFAHAYHWTSSHPADIVCETGYGRTFPSAVQNEHIFGVQFHPEKSHDGGLQLLRNFANL